MLYHFVELFVMAVFGSVFAAVCFLPWGKDLIDRNRGTVFFLLALFVTSVGRLLFYIYFGTGTVRYMLPAAILFVVLAPAGIVGICRLVEKRLTNNKIIRVRKFLLPLIVCLVCVIQVGKIVRVDRKDFIREFAKQLTPYNSPDTLLVALGDSGISILHNGPDRIKLHECGLENSYVYYEELLDFLPESARHYQEIFVMFRGGRRAGDPAPGEFEEVVKNRWSIFPFDLLAVSKSGKREYRLYRFNWKVGDGLSPVRRGKSFPVWRENSSLVALPFGKGGSFVDCRTLAEESIPDSGDFRAATVGNFFYRFNGKIFFMPGETPPEKMLLDIEYCNEFGWQSAKLRREFDIAAASSENGKTVFSSIVPEKPAPEFNANIRYDLFLPEKFIIPAKGSVFYGDNFKPFPLSNYWHSEVALSGEKKISAGCETFDDVMTVKLSYPPLDYKQEYKIGLQFAPPAEKCRRNLRILLVSFLPSMQENFAVYLRNAFQKSGLTDWGVDFLPKTAFPDEEFGYNRCGNMVRLVGEKCKKGNREYDLVLILPDDSDFHRRINWEDPQKVNLNKVFASGDVEEFFRGAGAKAVGALILPWQPAPGLIRHYSDGLFSGGVRKNTICAKLTNFVSEIKNPGLKTLFLPPVINPESDYQPMKDDFLNLAGYKYFNSQRLAAGGIEKIAGAIADWAMAEFVQK